MSVAPPGPGTVRQVFLVLLLLTVLALGVFSALYLVPWEDESGYLVLGALAVRGEISLQQDEILGERLPVPFYLFGATQRLAGRSLLAARLCSLLLGLGAVILVYILGCRLGGSACGALAAAFVGTQVMVVGYYATAMYHSLCSLTVMAGLYLIFEREAPLSGMAVFSLLSLIRPNMAIMVPFILVFLLLRSGPWRTRAALVALAVLPPALFFLSDPSHLKMLAYVPILHRLVEPLGYVSLFRLGGEAMTAGSDWPSGLAWFGRRYLVWLVVGLGLLAVALLARAHGSAAPSSGRRKMRVITGLLVYTLAWQGAILSHYPKSIVAWSASFAALGALVLGYHAARLLDDRRVPSAVRVAVACGLVTAFLVGPVLSAHTNLPRPLPAARTTVGVLGDAAAAVRAAIPPGSRVFLVGMSILPYLASVDPYPQQLIHSWTLVPRGEPAELRRNGLWGPADIEAWLGSETRFAIVQTSRLAAWRNVPAYRTVTDRIEELLGSRFRMVVQIDEYPLGMYRVYERREALARAENRF